MKRRRHVDLLKPLLVLVITTLTACGGSTAETSTPSSTASPNSKTLTAAAIQVESKQIIYLPDQQGGAFYDVLVLLKNTSGQVAINVTGQVSITSGGSLVKSVTPTSVNILPGDEGAWIESVDLGQTAADPTLSAIVSVDGGFRPGPIHGPVTFDRVKYQNAGNGLNGCSISGVVHNTFTQAKDNLQIRALGLNGSDIVTGGFTYVDKVFPATDATWTISMFSPSECPVAVERVLVLPNLGTDKIFNP